MRLGTLPRIVVLSLALSLVLTSGCKPRTAEERGKDAVDEKAGFIKGVGDGLKGAGRDAAQSMGGGVVQVWGGFKEGVEGATVGQVQISPELASYGAQVTRVQLTNGGVINAYLIAEKPLKYELRLRALDKDDREIGRAKAVVDFPADHAEYVDFAFDERTPMSMVTCFEMSAGAVPPAEVGQVGQEPGTAAAAPTTVPAE